MELDAKALPSSIRVHTIFMHDVVYCEPHYSVPNIKSHYKYVHNIFHKIM